ncbi:ADP-ribosyltransferase domain-containing protein [Emticicia sp. TH156]|uniref:ADP-ribosyltransferase domain-containing protein n=1 Tax=Emticicia sp. TH156 TaxID=2067454 RepID=UPI000C785948|nr:ADP-ribosyltransferase domain-containing protein [Emticicia sp. TH156]PLK44335.1 hypothetical protein C0V77_11120 [Emticicia sp. TH156]
MELEDYVIRHLSSALAAVQKLDLSDARLTSFEIALIYHYSEEGYESTNELLIKSNGNLMSDYARFLSLTLQKLPAYNQLVFRGCQLNKLQKQRYIEAFNSRTTIQEPLFLSTSKSSLIGNLFSKGDTLFTIYGKSGRDIENFSKFGVKSGQNEKEVLFLPNTSFEVLAVTKSGTKTLITLEEILIL